MKRAKRSEEAAPAAAGWLVLADAPEHAACCAARLLSSPLRKLASRELRWADRHHGLFRLRLSGHAPINQASGQGDIQLPAARSGSVSCGIIPGLKEPALLKSDVAHAVDLHGPTDLCSFPSRLVEAGNAQDLPSKPGRLVQKIS